MRRLTLLLLGVFALSAPAMSHAQTHKAPTTIRDTVMVAAMLRDTVALEQVDAVVRSRQREVQFCFEESGLKADPELSGIFAMMLTLDTTGAVARVDPVRGEWSGPDGAAVEACVMQRARAWRFPFESGAPWAIAPARHEVTFHFAR
jgi:hypothetical protein